MKAAIWMTSRKIMERQAIASGREPEKPVRMCVICKRRFAKRQLFRYVLNETGEKIFDEQKRAPGRGAYCCLDPGCREKFALWKPGRKKCKSGGILGR